MSASEDKTSILESRNVTVGSRRTSMRLEPQMWEAIENIARMEGVTLNNLCTQIDQRRRDVGLTSATRVFIVTYFRHLARRHEGEMQDPSLLRWVLDGMAVRRNQRGSGTRPAASKGPGAHYPGED